MKKILLLIILCFLLTGCTVNYNLEIEDNSFKETISGNVLNSEIKIDDEQTDVNTFNYLINEEQSPFIGENNQLYNKATNKNNNGIDYNYSFTYNELNITDSRILNTCFEDFKFEEKDNIYYLMTFGKFYCNYAPETNINISTEYEVIINNANKKKNNTYTWTINEENKDNFELYMTINKEKQNKNTIIEWNNFKTIGLIILLTLSGICIYLLKRKEQY